MKSLATVPFVDTNIIPDRNAGMGSLLWDLQNSRDAGRDGRPLLGRQFAFIDVGVSRAKVSTALKTLLARDLEMDVDYVATERLEAVPYANVAPQGDRAEKIRGCLSRMISSKQATREVTDWHCVVDCHGQVSSVAYSYDLHGSEVWESYFMGRTFMYSGENVEFADPELDEMLAPEVRRIETRIDQRAPSWDGYRLDKNPLEAGLAKFGITLQKVDVPQRIKGRQNVLFLGNVLNHYPQEEQARELDRIAANMAEGDIVIVQMDEPEMCSIEVLHVNGQEDPKARERVRWINTRTLEVQKLVRGSGSWRQIHLKPAVDRGMRRLMECLGLKLNSPEWSQEAHKALVHRHINHVFRTFFRAWPVEEIFRIAIREAVRRLPSEGGPKGIPVFEDDATDAYGGALGLDPSPLVSEADFVSLRSEPTARGETRAELETGVSLPGAPSVTITEFAMRRILELREGLGLPVKGLRVKAIPRSPLRADFSMRFVPAEEPESPTDSVQSVDGIDLYIAPDSAPYLEGATIDLVFRIIGSELTVVAPPRTQDTPAGRIAARIQQVLEEEINPSLATHGGEAILIDYKDDIVFLELTGGCQGCSSASATLKDGIEKSIRKSVPEVQEVRDVTQHANGTNPYFR